MSKTKNISIVVIVIMVIGVGLYFGLTSLKQITPEAGTQTKVSEVAPTEEEFPGGIIKLTVNTEDGFKPNTFTVKAGETIKVELSNTDTVYHIMQFRDPKIDLVLVGGPKGGGEETDSAEYTVPTDLLPAEYEFYDIYAESNLLPSLSGKMIVE